MISGAETVCKRFPDYGPCEIKDWKKFLKKEKTRFSDSFNGKKELSYGEKLSDLEKVTPLGSGAFGDVILVKHKKNGNYYAMKMMEKGKVIKNRQLEHIRNEKKILECIDHPLIVYLVCCFKDNSYIYLVMPFITGGEMFTHLRKSKTFPEEQAKFFASQVILAIEYLHYLDLVYRDLKPENILVDHTGYLKVVDFGFCKYLTSPRTFTVCGTPEYLAPEVLMNKGYGKAVDWWAIGVLLYEMVAGVSPFCAQCDLNIYEKILSLNYNIPLFFSDDLIDLVDKLLQIDVSRRYGNLKKGVKDIKGHSWFKTINWLAIVNRKVDAPWKPKHSGAGDVRNFCRLDWKPPVISEINLYAEEFEDF